tara:strand:+ start:867 stop:1082 length:216 start_codon:yes stop_codon:yes gene_type:complete
MAAAVAAVAEEESWLWMLVVAAAVVGVAVVVAVVALKPSFRPTKRTCPTFHVTLAWEGPLNRGFLLDILAL